MVALREQCLDKIGPVHEKILEIVNPNAVRALSPSTSTDTNSSMNRLSFRDNQPGNGLFHGSSSGNSVNSLANIETRRTSKRKLPNENALNAKRRGDVPKLERLVPKSFPGEYPFNKEGYRCVIGLISSMIAIACAFRYHLAEPDPHSPFRQKFDETEVWAGKSSVIVLGVRINFPFVLGKPIPGHLYRTFLENECLLSLNDRGTIVIEHVLFNSCSWTF